MIDAKGIMEFFEKEYNVQFVDAKTGKRALDIVAEKEKRKSISFNNSDYDKFLGEENNDESDKA